MKRQLIIAALALLMTSGAAMAETPQPADKTVICEGTRFQMQDHDEIGNCELLHNTRAFMQVRSFCKDDYCIFRGHIAKRIKETDGEPTYFIDSVRKQ